MSFINSDSYTIIGTESQIIHIILNKNEKININKKYLVSASSNELREVIYNKINSSYIENSKENTDKNLQKVDCPSIINLKNTKSNIEYLCLSKGGKIMTINPYLYDDLYIKLDSIIAFNNGVDIYTDDDKNKKLNTFYLYRNIIKRNNFRRNLIFQMEDLSQNQYCLIKPKIKFKLNEITPQNLSTFIFTKNNKISDLIFISGNNSLFEKKLGEGESIILYTSSLIAFEKTISFELIPDAENNLKSYVNSLNHIKIIGPGLIIFEPNQKIIQAYDNKRTLIIIIISVLSIVVNLIIYLLLFLE